MATILDRENTIAGTMDTVKIPSCNRSPSARRLCDITNTTHNVKLSSKDETVVFFSSVEKDCNEKLRRENAAMLRAIADRDKVIDVLNHELQKLKENMIKRTQQNQQFAQSNSQLLAELNIGKDKLKLQQHEFGIMSGMLKAKILELEEKVKNVYDHANGTSGSIKESEPEKHKLHSQSQRRLSRIPSAVPSNAGQTVRKGSTDNKRICVRRRSSIIKCEEPEEAVCAAAVPSNAGQTVRKGSTDNKRICVRRRSSIIKCEEPEEADLSKNVERISRSDSQADDPMQEEDGCSSLHSLPADSNCEKAVVDKAKHDKLVEKGEIIIESNKPVEERLPARRSSIGRPSRRASQKVISYKEVPLNIKMRRDN